MPFSQYLNDATLNWFRGSSFAAAPATNVYLSLHSSEPGALGANGDVTTAVAGTRTTVPITVFGAPSTPTGGGRRIANNSTVTVTASATGAATVTYFGLWDAASAGNFLCYGILAQPVSVLTGDLLRFLAGDLAIRGI
ncbi:MAG: hypothetical protein VKM98_08030 [Cyanobacteriota bacterium]|nr:hypothetical protein [Cyanobacteriota bacterium]